MVNLGGMHVGAESTFLKCGTTETDWKSYDSYRGGYKKFTTFEYPLDVQERAAESSSLLPVLVFLRKTVKGYYYHDPAKHTPVDIASCFWVEKGSRLTQVDVMRRMQSTIRHAVADAAAVDAIVAEMESGGESWQNLLHVSVLVNFSDGADRRAFPAEYLEV
jgi:hypothetical protein